MRGVQVPDKLYFKIGEVARLVGVEPYVLRYWEGEFSVIAPVKSRTNQRLYRHKDVEVVLHIKDLLYQQGFTIEGARKRLQEKVREEPPSPAALEPLLGKIRRELEGLLSLYNRAGP